ncbi:MAG: hypothetical protein PHU61_01045 [Candidatus Absconditabacteria bacterium]|nr:hypothetical protein [Candidatus Absconditabacteria bacterium]MDD3868115.1 hypothetical protein [Candidatus Absconditabacteria bacterium]MDD4714363.1 hypothetical protein [Candidatus Absconditabacteria bacterium]
MKRIQRDKREKIEFFLLQFLRIIIVIPLVWKIIALDRYNIINLGISLLLTFLPEGLEKAWKVKFSSGLKIVYWLFLIANAVFGDAFDFYGWVVFGVYPRDIMLHFLSGLVLTLFGFIVFYRLNNRRGLGEVKVSKGFLIFFAFYFSITCAAFWEYLEFLVDQIFGIVMGGDLEDTVRDMICATLGSIITVIWVNKKLEKTDPKWFFNFLFKRESTMKIAYK